ncbi:DUF6089 family protein [Capnocytophaga sp. ARDL2]|uniref:type IX secretion system protein PorG n=1 Tax=Capnocytophaga sp. ARDL2 TaxID=3238809 RepID=UPI0035577561
MKKIVFALSLVCFSMNSHAQINELGIVVGVINTITDIGSTKYINPKDFGFGFQYRWNRSPRHSWRLNYSNLSISGADKDSDMAFRKARNYHFSNKIHEFSAGLEFNFFPFDLHNEWVGFTPYMHLGIAAISYNESFFTNDVQVKNDTYKFTPAVPFALGLKTQLRKRLVFSAEVGARYTFTDNLDGSHPGINALNFGNPTSNDWYMFTKIAITYTFGKNPCYCTPINF